MKHYRETMGISQMKLAEMIGCSTTLIGNIEIKKRFPSAKNIDCIANALKVSQADLFSESEPPSLKKIASKQKLKNQLEKSVVEAIGKVIENF